MGRGVSGPGRTARKGWLLAGCLLLLLAGCRDIDLRLTIDDLSTKDPEWLFMQEISGPGGGAGDLFGCAVALSESAAGDFIIVGAEGYPAGVYTGRAFVYRRSGGSWVLDDALDPDTTWSSFGVSVDIAGTQAVVGAYADSTSASVGGALYVYELQAGNWTETYNYKGLENDDQLGATVSVAMDRVVAGAPWYTGLYNEMGRVVVFEKSGAWGWQTEVYANDGDTASDHFGAAVALDGDSLIVGAPDHDGTFANEGKAYIFQYSGGSWQKQTLPAFSGLVANNYLGQAVAIRGLYALAGAPNASAFTGVYINNIGSWSNSTLTAPGAGFGGAVALAEDYALVGAELEGSSRGAAFLFARKGSAWSPYQSLQPADLQAGDLFGCAVDIGSSYLVVGAEGRGASGEGAIFIYRLKEY